MNYNQLKLAIYTTYIQVDNSNIFSGPNHFIPYTQQINTFYVPESNFSFLTKVHGILDLPLKYDKICYFCNSGHAAWINCPGWD